MKIRAGYGEAAFPPPLRLELCGYGFYLDRRAEGVLDDLHARAVLLEKEGGRVLLASCDLIGFSLEDDAALRRAIAADLGLDPASVLLACTHTHTGPATTEALPGLGRGDRSYIAKLAPMVRAAAAAAAEDLAESTLSSGTEIPEALGYNRRTGLFEPLDPLLRAAVIPHPAGPILLLNYACHPVTLGPGTQVSADWPGAAVRALAVEGYRAVVFQGFCGDIDPACNRKAWGRGAEEDLALYGRILASRARKAAAAVRPVREGPIRAAMRTVDLPLRVPDPFDPTRERAALRARFAGAFPNMDRFLDEWEAAARAAYPRLRADPRLRGLPVQAVRAGGLLLAALPGEADCAYALRLAGRWGDLFCVGYAGGVGGYFPEARAFRDPSDYACYLAPRFFGGLFPFVPEIEDLLCEACEAALAGTGAAPP